MQKDVIVNEDNNENIIYVYQEKKWYWEKKFKKCSLRKCLNNN